jgi:hypothetical protein
MTLRLRENHTQISPLAQSLSALQGKRQRAARVSSDEQLMLNESPEHASKQS